VHRSLIESLFADAVLRGGARPARVIRMLLNLVFSDSMIHRSWPWLFAGLLLVAGPLDVARAQTKAQPAERFTLSGFVIDAHSGEKLVGANLYAPAHQIGTTTNQQGFFSLTLPADSVKLVISYLGYASRSVSLALSADRQATFELIPEDLILDEVEVVGEQTPSMLEQTQMSAIEMPVAQLQQVPVLLGETDVLKTLQLLPGAQSGTEGTSGLFVRGGSPDQNLILLDGAPLYNVSHLFGFLSVFNADVVNRVRLIKGGFPARYGGRLSSVIEVNMDDGNLRAYETDGAVGLLSSRLAVQGPIWEGRTSFMLSGRRTYADLLARPFQSADDLVGYYFYDVNAKVNHRFPSGDQLVWSAYAGDDRFYRDYLDNDGAGDEEQFDFGFGWGNVTSTLRWNHIFNDTLFGSLSLLYSRYRFDIDSRNESTSPTPDEAASTYALQYRSGIRDLGARFDFDYVPTPRHHVRFGGSVTHHVFRPGATQFEQTGGTAPIDTTLAPNGTIRGWEAALYVEDDIDVTSRLSTNVGLRATGFDVEDVFYTSLQPRLAARYRVAERWTLKASYAAMEQNIHLLTNSSTGLPTDLWVPATDRVAPQSAQQVAAGVAHTFGDGAFELTTEGYYKAMRNLIEYEEGTAFSLRADESWQDVVAAGRGWSYGAEVLLRRQQGCTTGWLGYTLSWTTREFDALNDGEPFPYRYDRRHDLSAVVTHRLTDVTSLSATWVYGTGDAITLPTARHRTPSSGLSRGLPLLDFGIKTYDERNGYRLRPYHRLDLGVNFTWTGDTEHALQLGFYNVYNRKNPFFVYTQEYPDGLRAQQVSLFPILPSINYRFSF
jgi:hypothetical protein